MEARYGQHPAMAENPIIIRVSGIEDCMDYAIPIQSAIDFNKTLETAIRQAQYSSNKKCPLCWEIMQWHEDKSHSYWRCDYCYTETTSEIDKQRT